MNNARANVTVALCCAGATTAVAWASAQGQAQPPNVHRRDVAASTDASRAARHRCPAFPSRSIRDRRCARRRRRISMAAIRFSSRRMLGIGSFRSCRPLRASSERSPSPRRPATLRSTSKCRCNHAPTRSPHLSAASVLSGCAADRRSGLERRCRWIWRRTSGGGPVGRRRAQCRRARRNRSGPRWSRDAAGGRRCRRALPTPHRRAQTRTPRQPSSRRRPTPRPISRDSCRPVSRWRALRPTRLRSTATTTPPTSIGAR